MACFTSVHDIGADIQVIDSDIKLKNLKSVFTSEEMRYLGNKNPSEIIRLWTRKESVVKALGYSMNIALDEVNTLNDVVEMENKTLNFVDILNLRNYKASLCVVDRKFDQDAEVEIQCMTVKIF